MLSLLRSIIDSFKTPSIPSELEAAPLEIALLLRLLHDCPPILGINAAIDLLYLADWRSCLTTGAPLTDITWQKHNYFHAAPVKPGFHTKILALPGVKKTPNADAHRTILTVPYRIPVPDAARPVIRHLAKNVPGNIIEFRRLVFSTYPMMSQAQGTVFDLPALAESYLSAMTADQRRLFRPA